MTTLQDLWPGVETAGQDDTHPLLVCADWCDDNDDAKLAFALRWCAGKRKRPFRRNDVTRKPWTWWRVTRSLEGELGPLKYKQRAHAFLYTVVFDCYPGETPKLVSFGSSVEAYRWLAKPLDAIRNFIEVPEIVVPPRPQIVGAVACPTCGLFRDGGRACPVCKA